MNLWDQVKRHLSMELSREAFQSWFSQTQYLRLERGALYVSVPNEANKQWLEAEYGEAIRRTIQSLEPSCAQVCFEVASNGSHGSEEMGLGRPPRPAGADGSALLGLEVFFTHPREQLDSRLSFDSFVVGSCNQFAHAAAQAVCRSPGRSYNPLFIYGGTGIGKTHLLHAIGLKLLETMPSVRIVNTSGERFMNAMVNSLKADRMPLFHRHFRSADVLLVDDIHILAGKERTQEEFFHTFNELFEHEKQIVITSDSPPKQMGGLVERLRSRFEWGLMVDMQPPDLETKMAILDKKAEQRGLSLPEDVRIFLATKTKSNVRELEGSLNKLIAYSDVTGSPITLAMAQQALKHLVQPAEKRHSLESILRAVADYSQLTPQQIKQKSNARNIALPRQIAMYLMRELTTASLAEIGKVFGGKHHTTVLHSIEKIERERQHDQELNNIIHKIIESLH